MMEQRAADTLRPFLHRLREVRLQAGGVVGVEPSDREECGLARNDARSGHELRRPLPAFADLQLGGILAPNRGGGDR
jgi:hypothetical protein